MHIQHAVAHTSQKKTVQYTIYYMLRHMLAVCLPIDLNQIGGQAASIRR